MRRTTVAETGSTNADVLALSGGSAPIEEGQWLIADRQTAGRGRMGRTWLDGLGNFMGSTIIALRPNDPPAHTLALVAAVAVVEALFDVTRKAPGLHAAIAIKWPNDIMVEDAKLGGILLERVGSRVAVGVGLNLAMAPMLPDRRTIALTQLGVDIGRDVYADALQTAFSGRVNGWRLGDWPDRIIARWMALAHPLGTPLSISEGAHAGLTGLFDGLERDGSLRLRLATGVTQVIHAGEVRRAQSV